MNGVSIRIVMEENASTIIEIIGDSLWYTHESQETRPSKIIFNFEGNNFRRPCMRQLEEIYQNLLEICLAEITFTGLQRSYCRADGVQLRSVMQGSASTIKGEILEQVFIGDFEERKSREEDNIYASAHGNLWER